jgi:hypothetical protein
VPKGNRIGGYSSGGGQVLFEVNSRTRSLLANSGYSSEEGGFCLRLMAEPTSCWLILDILVRRVGFV